VEAVEIYYSTMSLTVSPNCPVACALSKGTVAGSGKRASCSTWIGKMELFTFTRAVSLSASVEAYRFQLENNLRGYGDLVKMVSTGPS